MNPSPNDLQLRTDPNGAPQLVVPMPLPYLPIPHWVAGTDILALVLVPLWLVLSFVVRKVARIQPPPHAVFTVTPECFHVDFVCRENGDRSALECHPRQIVELRRNRYAKGLWLHIKGERMETYLEGFDGETVDAIADHLHRLLAQTLPKHQ